MNKEMEKRNAKIIKLRDAGRTIKSIAEEFGLSTTRVSGIITPRENKPALKKNHTANKKGKKC